MDEHGKLERMGWRNWYMRMHSTVTNGKVYFFVPLRHECMYMKSLR